MARSCNRGVRHPEDSLAHGGAIELDQACKRAGWREWLVGESLDAGVTAYHGRTNTGGAHVDDENAQSSVTSPCRSVTEEMPFRLARLGVPTCLG